MDRQAILNDLKKRIWQLPDYIRYIKISKN